MCHKKRKKVAIPSRDSSSFWQNRKLKKGRRIETVAIPSRDSSSFWLAGYPRISRFYFLSQSLREILLLSDCATKKGEEEWKFYVAIPSRDSSSFWPTPTKSQSPRGGLVAIPSRDSSSFWRVNPHSDEVIVKASQSLREILLLSDDVSGEMLFCFEDGSQSLREILLLSDEVL